MTKRLTLALLLAATTTALAQQAPQPAPPPGPTPSPAPADGTAVKTDDQKKAEAKAAYETGLSHYNLGEFDLAITSFKEAYAISSAPGLLFNIAQSYRLKKDYEQATYFYTTYLRLKPEASNRADVEARLEEMQKLIDDQNKMAEKKPTGTLTPDGATTVTTTTTVSNGTPAGSVTATNSHGGSPEDVAAARSLQTAGLATAGAGGALLVTGLVFGMLARSNEKDLNKLSTDMGTWSADAQSQYDAGKRDNTIAIISFIAGGAALVTGGAVYYLGVRKASKAHVAVVPTKGGAQFAATWSF